MTRRAVDGRNSVHPPIFFFFNDTATTEIYTLSLHDALPIFTSPPTVVSGADVIIGLELSDFWRSEEHTSELQSLTNLVCRLLLEKKNKNSRGYSDQLRA